MYNRKMLSITIRILGFSSLLLSIPSLSFSQAITNKGITFTSKDSALSVKLNGRIQSLYEGVYSVDNESYNDGMEIRRARLKMEGSVLKKVLEYKLEFGFSNSDIAGGRVQNSNTSNIVLDAVGKWNFAPAFSLWFGQTKLPGNRERVISSQKLQFVDRSLLNSRYNIDRDLGLQLHHSFNIGEVAFKEVASISMGEGRNITTGNQGGYDYTGRIEFYPMGEFKNDGDYFAADLDREPSPKLALGVSYDYNDRASRQRGQLGGFLSNYRDLKTVFADAMFKYKGISAMAEYVDKRSNGSSIVTTDASGEITERFFTGTGFNIQAGYLFKNNIELAGRFSLIRPENEIREADEAQYTLGLSKYIIGHTIKVQTDASLLRENERNKELMYRFQLEIGF